MSAANLPLAMDERKPAHYPNFQKVPNDYPRGHVHNVPQRGDHYIPLSIPRQHN